MYNTGTSVQRDDDRQKRAGDGSERLSARPNMTVAGTGVRDNVDRKKDNAGGQVCKYDDRGGHLERTKADAPGYAGKYDTLRCGTGICRNGERESGRQQRARRAVVAMWIIGLKLKRIDHINQ